MFNETHYAKFFESYMGDRTHHNKFVILKIFESYTGDGREPPYSPPHT